MLLVGDPDKNKEYLKQCSESDDIDPEDKGVQVIQALIENKGKPKSNKKQKQENNANDLIRIQRINKKDMYHLTPLHHAALRWVSLTNKTKYFRLRLKDEAERERERELKKT